MRQDGFAALSCRERNVLALVATGRSTSEIADCLGLAGSTVESHIRNAMAKLGATTRAQAAMLAASGDGCAFGGRLHCGQRRLLAELAAGRSVSAAARSLHISRRTAHRWLARSRETLKVESTVEALVRLHGSPKAVSQIDDVGGARPS